MTHTPPSWPDILDGALVTFHRFDDRGGDGVNFIEIRLPDKAALTNVKHSDASDSSSELRRVRAGGER